MKINKIKTNIFKDIIIPATKRIFNFTKADLVRQPATDTVEVSLLKENFQGISSKTFKKLLSPEFTPKTNLDESGLRITTLIDKKTNKPVNAYIARVKEDIPNMENTVLWLQMQTVK